MSMYESFAYVYDMFMDNVPYGEWGDYLIKCLQREGISDGILLDLGCGTGAMTRYLADHGYDMIGVDSSPEMLEEARMFGSDLLDDIDPEDSDEQTDIIDPIDCNNQTEYDSVPEVQILYLEQDMRSFELYGTVRAIVSVCDCMNYILSEQELLQVFRLANNYLDPGGLFLFDMNTAYKYRTLLGEETIAEARGDAAFIWENHWDEEQQINEYDLTLFIEDEDGRYERFDEVHAQRAYSVDEVCRLLKEAGLEIVSVTDAYTDLPVTDKTQRYLFCAREVCKSCD